VQQLWSCAVMRQIVRQALSLPLASLLYISDVLRLVLTALWLVAHRVCGARKAEV
jgi:hypothetical protein